MNGLQVRTLIDPRLAEPAMTPFSRIFYTWFHPDPVIMGADPLAVEAPERGREPFEANQATPTLIFLKPRDEVARTVPELYFLTRRRNPFRFLNSAIGVGNADDLKGVLAALEREPPKLVFHWPDDTLNTPFSLEIMAFVKRRYEALETRDGAAFRLEIHRYPTGR